MAATPTLLRAVRVATLAPILAASVLVLSLVSPALAGSNEGYLGVYLQELDAALAAALDLEADDGVLVKDVVEDSPAQAAGLQTGDIVLSVNGDAADDVADFTRSIRKFEPGEKIDLAILRKGSKKTISVELGEAENTFSLRRLDGEGPHRMFMGEDGKVQIFGDDEDGRFDVQIFGDHDGGAPFVRGPHARPSLGVTVHDFDENLGKYFGADEGVLVLGVIEGSAAEKAGLQSGDVIRSVAGEKVTQISELFSVLEDHEEGNEVAVEVLRDKKNQSFNVALDAGNAFDLARGPNSWMQGRRGMHDGNHFQWHSAPRAPRDLERLHEGPGAPRRLREHRELRRERGGDLRQELDELREELRALREKLEEEGGR